MTAAAFLSLVEDFDRPEPEPQEPPPQPPDIPPPTWADVEAARAQGRLDGRQEGRQEGLQEAAISNAALASSALATIAVELAAARETLAADADRAADDLAATLMAALAAALPDLCAAHGEREAMAVARMLLPALTHEPEVLVRVHPSIAPAMQRDIDRLAEEFVGRVTLQPSAAMLPGDVQFRWHDGKAMRDTRALCAQIAAALVPEPPAPAPDGGGAAAAERELAHVD